MRELQAYIRKEGQVLSEQVLKVNSFLNHQVDPNLVMDIGKTIAERYKDAGITKIVTIEASGIHIAFAAALSLGVPFLYAKKSKAITQSNEVYAASVYSFTRQQTYQITISKEFLASGDKVLIVDDILAEGAGVRGLGEIIQAAGCELVGVSVVIEKSFQNGRKMLDDAGVPVYALARIASMSPEKGIEFITEEPIEGDM
ncbi:xanthine phosphoribosyltransferase [Alicyclobacillus fastidiosus]|uniref:Xanthine phosphoribosyltransferase n=1 Tax=Alicyclobacillus fastidiosus TaxID=392011 RepID=A0ABY6ZGG4_9BACL|nr:xanthine phosphoribosyltransferase [Alicyclobacillus fastidiosus]WAH41926.1 xanthine phosphoribosyltransferase [Alicyclobacillus fastidiosus]